MSSKSSFWEGWFFKQIRHHWLTASFLFGFIIDNFTLNRVDQWFDNFILATYVILAMVSILLLYAGIAERLGSRMSRIARSYAPILLQFSFGGLLSGMLIFYSRSGAWAASWPFLLIILAVIYGNETIKNRSERLIFNLGVYFVGLFSYVVLVVPVVSGYMGAWVFVGSGLLALVVIYLFIQILALIIPNYLKQNMRPIVFTIGSIFSLLNIFYFTNIIPPIPLSLKEVKLVHSLERNESTKGVSYNLQEEARSWYEPDQYWKPVFHAKGSGAVYCFSKVFAPTKISVEIFHRWYYKNNDGKWIKHAEIPYPIVGGADQGYRGYSVISNFKEGEWRCAVETKRGQVLGQQTFYIDPTTASKELISVVE